VVAGSAWGAQAKERTTKHTKNAKTAESKKMSDTEHTEHTEKAEASGMNHEVQGLSLASEASQDNETTNQAERWRGG
jgi:hypothetical protein